MYTFVEWSPPINEFRKFIATYRRIMNCPLGGTRKSRQEYKHPTITTVLSVGSGDQIQSLPQRVCLSSFRLEPAITSHGCIYRAREGPHYLIVKHRDSPSYVEFIRGNYRESYLYFMIQELTSEERARLHSHTFEELWNDLHPSSTGLYSSEFQQMAQEKFTRIQPHLEELFAIVPSIDPSGKHLWVFPKGRPNWLSGEQVVPEDDEELDYVKKDAKLIPEAPFDCAVREFREETNGLDPTVQGKLLLDGPVVEQYLGSNSKHYQTNYFVFETDRPIELEPFPKVNTGVREVPDEEVSEMKWVSVFDLPNYLRPERLRLVEYIEKIRPEILESVDRVMEIWRRLPESESED